MNVALALQYFSLGVTVDGLLIACLAFLVVTVNGLLIACLDS